MAIGRAGCVLDAKLLRELLNKEGIGPEIDGAVDNHTVSLA
jgi:hypothetical protein